MDNSNDQDKNAGEGAKAGVPLENAGGQENASGTSQEGGAAASGATVAPPTTAAPAENGTQVPPKPVEAEKPLPQPSKGGVAAKISERLGGSAKPTGELRVDAAEPTAEQAPAFDFSKLGYDDLQRLKAMLASTPDRMMPKQTNPIILLRTIEGKLVVDFRDAFNTMQRDDLTNITSEVMMIPVQFYGAENVSIVEGKEVKTPLFVNVRYQDFMRSAQLKCEVIATRRVPGRIIEGEVQSRETGQMVERAITTVQDFFTVRLPKGMEPETVEIEGRMANA